MFRGEAIVLASLDDPDVVRLCGYAESPSVTGEPGDLIRQHRSEYPWIRSRAAAAAGRRRDGQGPVGPSTPPALPQYWAGFAPSPDTQ
jgi:hypothetical protein